MQLIESASMNPHVPHASAQQLFYIAIAWVCSVLVSIASPLLSIGAMFSPKLKDQLVGRSFSPQLLSKLNRTRQSASHAAVFFCSSAGEYEQGLPIITRLKEQGYFIVILFFSKSGLRYANARQESTACLLAPLDRIWVWRRFFMIIRPELTIVVRHEFWPGFLVAAAANSYLVLVNLSRPSSNKLTNAIKFLLLRIFNKIFVVSNDDKKFYTAKLNVEVSGDTKYDRVIERAIQHKHQIDELKVFFDSKFGKCQKLVVGSAWHADVNIVLDAYLKNFTMFNEPWLVIIAPHDVTDHTIDWIDTECKRRGLPSVRYSCLPELERDQLDSTRVVIVDQIGRLAEIYGIANLCHVGGALHHKVHNVLEPAVHGLRLSYGPRYSSQPEAVYFVKTKLASVIKNENDLAAWWLEHQLDPVSDRQRIIRCVRDLAGASGYIVDAITQEK